MTQKNGTRIIFLISFQRKYLSTNIELAFKTAWLAVNHQNFSSCSNWYLATSQKNVFQIFQLTLLNYHFSMIGNSTVKIIHHFFTCWQISTLTRTKVLMIDSPIVQIWKQVQSLLTAVYVEKRSKNNTCTVFLGHLVLMFLIIGIKFIV